jgi:hypothetical protein
VPDFAFLFATGPRRLICLVEVSSGEESGVRLRQKLEAYDAWSVSPAASDFLVDVYRRHGARQPRPEFRLVFCVENKRTGRHYTRVRQILRATLQCSEDLRRRLWITTLNELRQGLAAPIWIRASDGAARFAPISTLSRYQFFPPEQEDAP